MADSKDTVPVAEIAAYLEDAADDTTVRKVVGTALYDTRLRETLRVAERATTYLADSDTESAEATSTEGTEDAVQRLRARLLKSD
jgi:hypothetical protein